MMRVSPETPSFIRVIGRLLHIKNRFAAAAGIRISRVAVRALFSAVCMAGVMTAYGGKYSGEFESGGYALGAAEYLRLAAHAQPASLGSAVAAWQEDLNGMRVNPAILDFADSLSLKVTTSFLSFDRKLLAADIVGPVGDYTIVGVSFSSLKIEDIEGRDEFGTPTGLFNNREQAVAVSVAGRATEGLAMGMTARYLGQQLESERASGVGFDVGATWVPVRHLCVGVSATSLLSRLWWSTGHADWIQPAATGAANVNFLDNSVSAEIDITKPLRQPFEMAVGAQYAFAGLLFFRGGVSTSIDHRSRQYRDPDVSGGLGIRYSYFGTDYAFVSRSPGSDLELGQAHLFSFWLEIPSLVE